MINLKLNSKILTDAMLFCSKLKNRYILTGVSIKANAGRLEICSTDGARLYLATRELEPSEQIQDSYILKFPKLKPTIGDLFLSKEGDYIFINSKDGRALCEVIDGRFPNYWAVVPENADLSKMEHAKEYALFKWEYLRDLKKVIGREFVPLAKNGVAPHFWQDEQGNYKITVVILPLRN